MLDQSSTASDLIHTLTDPETWLMGLLSNFVSYDYDTKTSMIRIGTTGRGILTNYIIQEPSNLVTLEIGAVQLQLTVIPHRTFSGRDHREMAELDDLEWRGDHWSSKAITFDKAQALLAKLCQSRTTH
jgi:hypothetical protein